MPQIETLLGLARSAGHVDMAIPKRQASAYPYDAAGFGRRARGWTASKLGPNSVLFTSAEILRDRSRDAVRKNPYAANAVATWVSEAIGNGIKPQSQHPDRAVRELINAVWRRFVDDSDSTGKLNFYGQQALAFRSMVESGEVLCRFRLRPDRRDLFLPLQLQLIESDQLPIYATFFPEALDGNTVREGIEFTPEMDIAAYHIYREHPYDSTFFSDDPYQTVRIDGSDVLHVFQVLRPGQFRGQPWLAQILIKLYELDKYTDAENMRKQMAAMLALFIETPNGSDDAVLGERVGIDGQFSDASLEPGTATYLRPGEKPFQINPPADNGYDTYISSEIRGAAVGCGLTYELLSGDLRRVNYSSIRTGLLKFRRACEQIQYQLFVHQFCRPVWKRVIREAVLADVLDLPGYEKDPWPFEQVKWVTPGWPWIDPAKDIDAAQKAVRSGFNSRTTVVAEQGEDVDQIDSEIAMDRERAKQYGNVYDSDPTQVLLGRETNPTAPEPPQTEDPAEETDSEPESNQ